MVNDFHPPSNPPSSSPSLPVSNPRKQEREILTRSSRRVGDPSLQSQKGGKMASIIGYRIKVTLNDSRTLTGQMLAFDKHMNLVIAECEEFRRLKSKKAKKGNTNPEERNDDEEEEEEMKRLLGLVILRGETIVTLSVEGPPPAVDESRGPQVSCSVSSVPFERRATPHPFSFFRVPDLTRTRNGSPRRPRNGTLLRAHHVCPSSPLVSSPLFLSTNALVTRRAAPQFMPPGMPGMAGGFAPGPPGGGGFAPPPGGFAPPGFVPPPQAYVQLGCFFKA